MTSITDRQATLAVDGRHWHSIGGRLRGDWRAPDAAAAVTFAGRVLAAAEVGRLHPDVVLHGERVSVLTARTGGLTRADVDLTREVVELADELGLDPLRPAATLDVALGIDALDIPAVRPFWQAVLGYDEVGGDLHDPAGVGPMVWFQQMDVPRPQRNRIHFDVTVAHDEALARIDAALAVGGHLVTDAYAPSWWVLSDVEGNEVCVCTWRDRQEDDRGAPAGSPGTVA